MEYFKPAPTLTIKDLENLRVITEPLRNQIVEVLIPQPLTVGQIAERLGLAASKLYYHVNLLEQHDFIRVVDTTTRGNLIEKHYWVTALEYCIDEQLLNFSTTQGKENIYAMLTAVLDTTREDLIRSLEARAFHLERGAKEHPRRVVNLRVVSKLSDDKANEFMERLHALIKEFEAADDSERDVETHPYALTLVAYPTFYYEDPSEDG